MEGQLEAHASAVLLAPQGSIAGVVRELLRDHANRASLAQEVSTDPGAAEPLLACVCALLVQAPIQSSFVMDCRAAAVDSR